MTQFEIAARTTVGMCNMMADLLNRTQIEINAYNYTPEMVLVAIKAVSEKYLLGLTRYPLVPMEKGNSASGVELSSEEHFAIMEQEYKEKMEAIIRANGNDMPIISPIYQHSNN